MSIALFWLSLSLIIYTYLGYPLLLYLLIRVKKVDSIAKKEITPPVTLIISAYNEEKIIRQKIENSLSMDYPEDKLEIIVASDGSTDKTDDIVREFSHKGVILHSQKKRGGKNAVLNEAVAQARGEIMVFSDANSMYKKDAIQKLVRNFYDEQVGSVCGELVYINPNDNPVAEGYGVYWRYDQSLKRMENKLNSVLGANGSIFAIRKELNQPLKPNTSNDMVLPIKIAAVGYYSLYEPEAVCNESGSMDMRDELRRRSRIIARGLLGVKEVFALLLEKKKYLLLTELISKKLMRYLFPLLMMALFFSNCFLRHGIYRFFLIAQIFFYLLFPLGYLLDIKGKRIRFFHIPYYFFLGNLAALLGMVKLLISQELVTWETADRKYGL